MSDSLEIANDHIKNSFDLYGLAKIVSESDILISLDVVSLFINVLLDLAIDGVSKRWTYTQHQYS